MDGELFKQLIDNFGRICGQIPDNRRPGHNERYRIADIVKSAFGVFFFQHRSLLDYQRKMKEKQGRNNLETVFGVTALPSDTWIRAQMDKIAPEQFSGIFDSTLKIADEAGLIEGYRVLDGGVLIALDGVWYHASENIHCGRCLHMTKGGVTTYYHSALAGAIVRPGSTSVMPVIAEMIGNGDGEKKQDCELAAGKRWVTKYGEAYRWLKPTLLGDDLYSHEPFCRQVQEAGYSFIFTCKDTTHPWLAETVSQSEGEELSRREWNGRHHVVYTWRWVNGVPIRYEEREEDTFSVNYLEMSIVNEKTGKRTYYNSWITNKAIDAGNVEQVANCGRARWKIENEHNNVLKNHGYNLEHNFGHGENHASENFCLLNLVAFLFHTVLYLGDEQYRAARNRSGRRDNFFSALRYIFSRFLHKNWSAFILFVWGDEPDG
jgi:hypothetical protein